MNKKTEYTYPLDLEWSMDEMVKVTNFYAVVEQAYEEGIKAENFLVKYQEFKTVIRSIAEEKRLGREFEKVSGYTIYKVVKKAQEIQKGRFKMEG
ncbi:MAG: UPF0223 family protein [Streptococcaceae bacterium]|jgi:uncharacterized protein YktA (UPF0223 family)|nr:UPF0223 family protein [Streptococcaceae bacterium]